MDELYKEFTIQGQEGQFDMWVMIHKTQDTLWGVKLMRQNALHLYSQIVLHDTDTQGQVNRPQTL